MIFNAVLTVVFVSVFRSCASSPQYLTSCEDDVHLACTNKPFHDSLHDDGFSLLAEDTLVKHCSDILEDIVCKRNFLSNCDPSGFEAFALATDGVRDVLGELCNETTELRRAYHNHSSCIAYNTDLYEECILGTVDVGGSPEPEEYDSNGSDITSGDSTIKRMCRFYEPFKTCVTQATRTTCGDSAAQLVEQIVVRFASPAINEKCTFRKK